MKFGQGGSENDLRSLSGAALRVLRVIKSVTARAGGGCGALYIMIVITSHRTRRHFAPENNLAPLLPFPVLRPHRPSMQVPDYIKSYEAHLDALIAAHGREEAMSLVVGGQYHGIGILESSALLSHGLRPEHNVIDVGCGSGRLAVALRPFLAAAPGGGGEISRHRCARPRLGLRPRKMRAA